MVRLLHCPELTSPLAPLRPYGAFLCRSQSLPLTRSAHKKPPLCKGRWQKSLIFDGGVVNEKSNIRKT